MRRLLVLGLLLGGFAVTPALAQKTAPPVTRDTDRDGVPDTRDRCRTSPANSRVGPDGCPAPVPPPAAPQQVATNPATTPATTPANTTTTRVTPPVQTQAQPPANPNPAANDPARPGTDRPANPQPGNAPAVGNPTTPVVTPPGTAAPNRPSGLPSPANTQPTGQAANQPNSQAANRPANQAANPAGANPPANQPATNPVSQPTTPVRPAPAPVSDPSLTAGYWMPAYSGENETDLLNYARLLASKTDSAIVALVAIFRNTSGAPMVGATGPTVISSRERGRWERCRLLHFDLRTLAEASAFLKDSLSGSPTFTRALVTLDDAYQGLSASEECDNVVSMIEAPDRWPPWQSNYETSARNFYRDWYTQLRAVHNANRAFVGNLNSRLGARALPVPAALPPRPPTIGG